MKICRPDSAIAWPVVTVPVVFAVTTRFWVPVNVTDAMGRDSVFRVTTNDHPGTISSQVGKTLAVDPLIDTKLSVQAPSKPSPDRFEESEFKAPDW